MINYSNSKLRNKYKYNQMNTSSSRNQNQLPLLGKAVLLIGSDTAVIQNLVMQLAQRGADIVILCWRLPSETASWISSQLQTLDRRFFLVEKAENQGSSLSDLVHYIASNWGHFDFFIDVSAKRDQSAANLYDEERNLEEQQSEKANNRPSTAWHPNQWHVTQVVLEEMDRA